jgi:hypothetical protein
MSKPEDIPQDVWEAAALPSEYVDAIDRRYHISRAIMAAKEQERAACVSIVFGSYRSRGELCYKIIHAIRKRGES